jgi:low temperature requirement protein LtrA
MPLTKWQPPVPRREVDNDDGVTWLELFFDLIYVAALIQLGDRLAGDVSLSGAVGFVGVFVVLWWTWTGTTAFTNRFAVDDVVHRLLTFAQMFAVGNLAVVAAGRPDRWQLWLVLSYVAARLPLLIMYLRVRRTGSELRRAADLYLSVFSASMVIWLVSLAIPGTARYWVWAAALTVELAAPVLVVRREEEPPTSSEHFQERYALFTIIVLGETFVKTLTEISGIGINARTEVYGAIVFVILIAIWWTYFDDVADAHIRAVSPFSNRPSTNRLLWVYSHLPLAAGITAYGVATKKIVGIDAFDTAWKASYTWLLVTALVVTLLSVAVLDLLTASPHYAVGAPDRVIPRLVAAVILVPVGFITASGAVSALIGLLLVAAVVVVQIGVEVLAAARSEYRLGREVRSMASDRAGGCVHLAVASLPDVDAAVTCSACDREGEQWVQLRVCLTCGHIGCCDDSPGRHATAHHTETGHALIATMQAGDHWAYCYLDDVTDPQWLDTAGRRHAR